MGLCLWFSLAVPIGCIGGGPGEGEEYGPRRGRPVGASLRDTAGRAQRGPNLFIVNFGTREEECEERRGFAGH